MSDLAAIGGGGSKNRIRSHVSSPSLQITNTLIHSKCDGDRNFEGEKKKKEKKTGEEEVGSGESKKK